MTGLSRAYVGYLIFVPIIFLLVVGAAIAVRSGVDELKSRGDFAQLAANFSRMMLRIAAYVAVLLAVQYMVGLRPSLGW